MVGGFSRAAMLVLTLAAAGCTATPPPPPVALVPPVTVPECIVGLVERAVLFVPVTNLPTSGRCAVDTPVRLEGAAIAWNHPATVACALATTLQGFESGIVQPLAQAQLGQAVRRVHHLGTYSCRTIRHGGTASLHASGQAIDVAAFELADGTMVSVKDDWNRPGPKSAFLHAVAARACKVFSVVLTPNYDHDHQDHLHLDIGPSHYCGL